MDTTTSAPVGLWIVMGLALALAPLILLGAALAGRLPWVAPLGAWRLANALIPLATLRRPAPSAAPGIAGD